MRQRYDERRAGLREGPGRSAHGTCESAGHPYGRNDGHDVHRFRPLQEPVGGNDPFGQGVRYGHPQDNQENVRGVRQTVRRRTGRKYGEMT